MVNIRQRVRSIFKKKKKEPAPVQTKAPVQSIPRKVAGPTRPGTDVPTFRATGRSVQVQSDPRRGGGGRAAPTQTPRPVQSIPGITTPKPKPKPLPTKITGDEFIRLRERNIARIRSRNKAITQKQASRLAIQSIERRNRSIELARQKVKQTQTFKPIVQSFPLKEIKKGKILSSKFFSKLRRGGDIVSGGFFTSKKINDDQDNLNKQIEKFNKDFGERELSEAEFKAANFRASQFEKRQKEIIKRKEKLDSSARKKFGELVFGLKGTQIRSQTESEKKKTLKNNKEVLKSVNKELQNKNISKINKIRLNTVKKNAQSIISKIESGKDIKTGVVASTVPITPVGLPFGVTKLKVVFVGSQTTKGGKIITTVALKSNKGIEGFAKGVTTKSGKTSVTITKGRFGTRAIKFPTGKTGIIKKRTFVAVEKAISKKDVFALKRTVDTLRRSRKKIKLTQTNIKGLIQAGKGRVIVARGKRLVKTTLKIPSGKLVTKKKKGLTIDDFSSLAAIIPKKDLNLIIGRTITSKGDKAKFIGLIKGSGKLGKGKDGGLSQVQQQQFKQALKTVLSSATSAVAKADKAKGLTKAQKLALASTNITLPPKKITPKKPTKPKLKVVPRPRFVGVPPSALAGRGPQFEFQPGLQVSGIGLKTLTNLNKQIQQKGLSVKQRNVLRGKQIQIRKQLSNQFSRSRQRFLQQSKARQKQLSKQLQNSRLTQKQRGLLKQRSQLLQKQITKVKALRVTPRFSIPRFSKLLKPIPLPRRKRGVIKRKKVSKVKQSYNVKARPRRIKGRKIPKQIKVNKVPLSKRDAMNLRNKILDQSLARTGSIVKTRGKPQKPKLPVRKNFAKATKPKFRTHKSVKGKRVPLPRGRVIEKSKHLLDTRSEKKQIGLRKRIAQLNKQAQAKTRTKRKLSPKQLAALAQGRKKRSQNVRRRKK